MARMLLFTLFARDFRARLRDRSAIVLALLAPAALMTVLSMLAQGPDIEKVPVGVVLGDSPLASALSDGPLAALERDGTLRTKEYDDEAALRAAIDDDAVDAGISVTRSGDAVTILADAGSPIAGAIVEAVTRSTAITVDGVRQAIAAEESLGTSADPTQVATAVIAHPAPAQVVDATGADGINAKTQVGAGMATFFLFFTVQFGVLGLLEERRLGTLPRILVAPVPRWQVVISKVLVSFVLGLASMTALLIFASTLLGAHFGSPFGVALLVVSGVSAAVATVSCVVGLSRTAEQAGAIQSGVALVLGILGGSFFSLARAGGLAGIATRATPHYWFNEGLVRLSGGQSWTHALPPVAALLAFTVIVGVPGLLLAGRTVRP
ncbi:MAG: ABC transporter permease [Nocardioides sp.]|uniref:ABC transporter permease n=1 Tax=Nocardioides sp. TaxID=35761 RepID=UPI0039E2E4A2